jgi:uncharacterized membrane protein
MAGMTRRPMAGMTRRAGLAIPLLAALLATVTPAHAELKLCNMTPSRIGVALGYRTAASNGWVTEGWWNILSQGCETLLPGTLETQYYYVYAIDYDRGGGWEGDGKYSMCIADKSFTITRKGLAECTRDGYKTARFLEIDTGQSNTFTIRLTEPAPLEAAAP